MILPSRPSGGGSGGEISSEGVSKMDNAGQNAQNVILMSDHRTYAGYGPLAQVEAYWEALRGNRLMPCRSDIDPRGIEEALPYAFILERVAPGVARLRIAGTHLRELMGMEVRGMPITSFFTNAARPLVAEALEDVFQLPGQTTLHLTSAATYGKPALEARMLLLPLKSDLGDVSRALGCLMAVGDLGKAPRRFDLTHQDRSGNLVSPATSFVRDPAPAAERGFAESAALFDPPAAKRLPPYLRVVKTDKE
ncbi:PAS domain-containing protein [Sulfitobacter delicatus]|uniref:PAS domain-containing protein n=1 Tax=Sulfitobacter delicatus TaxID=218672 RepID=A0A1G7QXZ5_9RHOB|nr:PAS domain-containing protein [Sulfitobacter delicatus]SDG03367.1 PAS domain-containing protein [Sulfitobacter delicatus]